MSDEPTKMQLEEDACSQIFLVSTGMVGVCLTVIGLVQVVITVRQVDSLADDLLALDAILFMISGLAAYWALRTRNVRRMHRVELFADKVFLAAMLLMGAICVFITYAISRY
jgi:hypothetical protein